jgi:hypothetical protein
MGDFIEWIYNNITVTHKKIILYYVIIKQTKDMSAPERRGGKGGEK